MRPTDGPALGHFYAALSPASRYSRFMGFSRGMDDDRALSLCTPDHRHDEGLVAVLAGPRPELIVGHLCLQPAGRKTVELAVAVSDEHQGLGIGRRLMEGAVRWAMENGFEQITATAFADNWRVLRLLSATPYAPRVLPADAGTVEVIIPLSPPATD